MNRFAELEKQLIEFSRMLPKMTDFIYEFIGSNNLQFLNIPYKIDGLINGSDYERLSEKIRWFLDSNKSNAYQVKKDLERMKPFSDQTVKEMIADNKDRWYDEVEYYKSREQDIRDQIEEGKDYLKGGKKFDEGDPYPDYETAQKWIDSIYSGMDIVEEYIKELSDLEKNVVAHLGDIERSMQQFHQGGGSEIMPDTKDREVLYHATVAGDAILSQGFKTRKEIGKGALGGGPDDVISFTADPEIAKAIAVALVEVIRIAKGQITFETVMQMAKQHGINLEDSSFYKEYTWFKEEQSKGTLGNTTTTEKELVFNLYRLYLSGLGEKGVRYNPWFAFVSIDEFASLQEKDVAVVACHINMKSDNLSWLASMQELRVPISAIGRCRKIPYQ